MVVKEEQKNDNPRDDEINSLVSSLLKPIFSIIYKIIPPQIKLSRYIWYIITILFLLLGLQYQFLNLKTTIIIFVSILVLEIASLNIDIIKSLFKNKNKDRIQTFLTDINNKDLGAIINFLDNNNLETNDLKILLETKYKNNIDLHKKIIKTQDYNCDFIDFLINKKIINSIPPHLISRYILWCPTSLNDVSLHYLSQIDSIKIKGSLALTHPILV
ncbi:MAG: hypothetical protein Q8R04_02610, partial [Nanoarchaeota archaeon]|nr:hypothetical protein [Nanoarchaeota archaeon]